MPDWYSIIDLARYARMSAPDFVRLPVFWQQMYETAQLAEMEAANSTVETE